MNKSGSHLYMGTRVGEGGSLPWQSKKYSPPEDYGHTQCKNHSDS